MVKSYLFPAYRIHVALARVSLGGVEWIRDDSGVG